MNTHSSLLRLLRAVAACLACSVLTAGMWLGTAQAAPRAKAPAKASQGSADLRLQLIDPALGTVPFGEGVDKTLEWVRGRLEVEYGPRKQRALDSNERSRLTEEMANKLRLMSEGVVSFDGQRTGFEVSIVAAEFVAGADESLLLFREGPIAHYFFFTHGQLWKYVRPLPSDLSFADRLAVQVKEQGAPASVVRARGEPDAAVVEARWTGKRRQLRILDRRSLYRADLLIVEDRGLADRIDVLRGGKQPALLGGVVDPDLDDFLDNGSDDDEPRRDDGD